MRSFWHVIKENLPLTSPLPIPYTTLTQPLLTCLSSLVILMGYRQTLYLISAPNTTTNIFRTLEFPYPYPRLTPPLPSLVLNHLTHKYISGGRKGNFSEHSDLTSDLIYIHWISQDLDNLYCKIICIWKWFAPSLTSECQFGQKSCLFLFGGTTDLL